MYVGAYDAPVSDLSSYRLRLEELALLGFRSVGLAIDWEKQPRNLAAEEKRAIAALIEEYGLELRLHPDLGKLHNRAKGDNRPVPQIRRVRNKANPHHRPRLQDSRRPTSTIVSGDYQQSRSNCRRYCLITRENSLLRNKKQ